MSDRIQRIEELARAAVPRVFQGMLSMDVQAEEPTPLADDPLGQIIGSVGFIGDTSGIIFLYAPMTFAREITGRMLGLAEGEPIGDEMVADAIGELSNQVVGHVKSRLCDAGQPCTLTIPSVVRGRQLSVEGASNVTRKMMGFRNSHHHLLAGVLLKD